jgi:hypothetical protein
MPDPSKFPELKDLVDQSAASYGMPVALLTRVLFSGGYRSEGEDPYTSIPREAQYIASLAKRFNGDYQKALAAYYTSPTTVAAAEKKAKASGVNLNIGAGIGIPGTPLAVGKKLKSIDLFGGSSWQSYLDKDTQTKLSTAWAGGTSDESLPPGLITSAFKPGGPSGGTSRYVPAGTIPEPRIEDYWDSFNNRYDYQSYVEDRQAVRSMNQEGITDAMAYLDLVTQQLSNEIALSNMSMQQANEEFSRRMEALQTGNAMFTQMLQNVIPPTGTGYVYGGEPGGFASQLGLPPTPYRPTNLDPYAMANQIVAGSSYGSISTPSAGLQQDAFKMVQDAILKARQMQTQQQGSGATYNPDVYSSGEYGGF